MFGNSLQKFQVNSETCIGIAQNRYWLVGHSKPAKKGWIKSKLPNQFKSECETDSQPKRLHFNVEKQFKGPPVLFLKSDSFLVQKSSRDEELY